MPQRRSSAPALGLRNLRDVGDVPTVDGRRVLPGRLYRSDAPFPGDPEPPLRPWPPRTVVDLRSPGEAARPAHPLASDTTEIVNIPLLRELDPTRMARREDVELGDLPSIYRGVVTASARALTRIVEIVALRPGPVLLHCAAGKDRTGVATAIVLVAVGVPAEDIVADYRRTEASLDDLPERLAAGWSEGQREATLHRLTVERPDLLLAPAGAIEAVLEAVEAWQGGVEGWLRDHGVTDATAAELRRRLTEPADGEPARAAPAAR